MTQDTLAPDSLFQDTPLQDIPALWRTQTVQQLQNNEHVLAALVFDLDTQLHFVQGLLLVTNQGLLSRTPDGRWQHWPYQSGLLLKLHDHAGVGQLELVDSHARLANWRFTLAHNLHAIRLVDQFQIYQTSFETGLPALLPDGHRCPTCKAPLEPDQDECPICTKVIHTPPST